MRKNVMPIAMNIFDFDVEPITDLKKLWLEKKPLMFDQDHCSKMNEHRYYKELATQDWDTFRDLKRVFDSSFTKQDGELTGRQIYSFHNTLMIDSDEDKV